MRRATSSSTRAGPMKEARRSRGGPAYANLQGRKPRKMWGVVRQALWGFGHWRSFCRGGLAAFSAGDCGWDEAGRSIARGRIGVARRRWNDTATIVSNATASMVIADR